MVHTVTIGTPADPRTANNGQAWLEKTKFPRSQRRLGPV
jgi:hypothetical protein